MKKTLCLLLAFVFVFSLTSCGVDFDLTNLDAHNAMSSLDLIRSNYEMNEGKTIKIKGEISNFTTNMGEHHLVFIKETSHDHSDYIEFILKNPPEEYPEGGTVITVTGKLSKYEYNGFTYYTLIDAKMKVH